MRPGHLAAIIILATLLFALVSPFAGAGDDDQDIVRRALEKGELLPLTKILEVTAANVPGDVIKIELERDDGVIIYELKVLAANGRVRELELDARTGKVLKIEDD